MNLHFLLLALTQLLPASQGTSFYIRPFSEFTQSTPNIVRGTLSNIHAESTIDPNGMKGIYTFANLAIKEVLKGQIQGTAITVRKIGGTVDGYTVEVPSSPDFKEQEETVLFLSEAKEDHSYEVEALELGKFELEEKNGETLLRGGLFNYSKPNAEGEMAESLLKAKNIAENQKDWSLNALKNLIQEQGLQKEVNPQKVDSTTSQASASPDPKAFEATPTPESEHDPLLNPENSKPYLLLFVAVLLAIGTFLYRKKK